MFEISVFIKKYIYLKSSSYTHRDLNFGSVVYYVDFYVIYYIMYSVSLCSAVCRDVTVVFMC